VCGGVRAPLCRRKNQTPKQLKLLQAQRARKRKAMGVPEPAPAPAYKTTAADRKARAEAEATRKALMAQLPSELEQNSREIQYHIYVPGSSPGEG